MAGALGPLAFWEGYEGELVTLGAYAVGLAIYALLVGVFYNTLSHRNLVPAEKGRKRLGAFTYLLLFPVVSFGFFLVLSIALFFLAKNLAGVPEPQRVRDILMLSMALVAGVRVAAYINEGAAADLGKLLPLGLLGVLLVDPGFLSLNTPFVRLAMLPAMIDLIGRFFVVIVVLELALRALWVITGGPGRARAAEAKAAAGGSAPAAAQAAPPKQG